MPLFALLTPTSSLRRVHPAAAVLRERPSCPVPQVRDTPPRDLLLQGQPSGDPAPSPAGRTPSLGTTPAQFLPCRGASGVGRLALGWHVRGMSPYGFGWWGARGGGECYMAGNHLPTLPSQDLNYFSQLNFCD